MTGRLSSRVARNIRVVIRVWWCCRASSGSCRRGFLLRSSACGWMEDPTHPWVWSTK